MSSNNSRMLSSWSWDGRILGSTKPIREEEIFDSESKKDDASLDAIGLSRWNKIKVLLGPELYQG